MVGTRMIAAGLAVLGGAFAQDCFTEGMEYVGQQVIAPGYTHSPQVCQAQCATQLYCAYFTWKAEPNKTASLGPGSCRKFNDQATLQPADGQANLTISGPNACPTTTGSGTTPTAPPLPTMPALPTMPGVPTLPPTDVNGSNASATNGTNGTVVPIGGETQRGGFPWWAILLICLVIVGVGAAVIYGTCDEKKKKKKKDSKKSKKDKSAVAATAAAVEAGEAQQLMQAEAPPPVVEVQQPMQVAQLSGSPVATTQMVTTMSGSYMQPQQVVYNSQGQVVQMPMQMVQQEPVMTMVSSQGAQIQMPLLTTGSARAPQFR